MSIRYRLLGAASVGLASAAACTSTLPTSAAQPQARDVWTYDASDAGAEPVLGASPAEGASKRDGKLEDAGSPADGGAPRCPYGELADPHRGFVRCLLPEERDAGWLPPPPQGDAPPAAPPPPPPRDTPRAAPPLVTIGAPSFQNGRVTKVERSLGRAEREIARCVAEHGGLSGATGSLKVQFLVRSRGRAEGVEVLAAKGVSSEAASCVRVLLKNKAIGAPSADPVGVTVTISFKAPKP